VKSLPPASTGKVLAASVTILTLLLGGCRSVPTVGGHAGTPLPQSSSPSQTYMPSQDPDRLVAAGVARQVTMGRSTARFLHTTGAKATAELFPIGEAEAGVRGLTHDPDVLVVLITDFTTWQGPHITGAKEVKNPPATGAAWLQIIGRSGSDGRPVAASEVVTKLALLNSFGGPTKIEVEG